MVDDADGGMAGRRRHLEGRVALVTGGGLGIGRAHALRLASHGAAVVVNDIGVATDGTGRDRGRADAVVSEITAAGGRAAADRHDIASFEGGAALVAATLEQFGRLDIVVNNAGIVDDAPMEEITEEMLLRLVGVHYVGTVGVCRAAVGPLRAQGWGRIINTTSEAALDSRFAGGIAYAGAKAAVWAATLAMARQLQGSGVTANCLSPGARTRMNDALFAGGEPAVDLDPDHVAKVVAVLAGEAAGHLNGLVIHAAAGAVREYEIRRTGASPAAVWIAEATARLGR